jgi:hypothetical protein
LLQKYIIEYKTRQATQNLEFIEARLKEKKAEFETAREAFFEYRDRNRNIIEDLTNIRYQELRVPTTWLLRFIRVWQNKRNKLK